MCHKSVWAEQPAPYAEVDLSDYSVLFTSTHLAGGATMVPTTISIAVPGALL